MRISPDCVRTTEDLRKLAALIRGYFDQGGHHVQFNIVDREVLLDAMARPEQHRDLMVRVAGYSDYFVLLSPEIQREILSRTEHGL
jgi:formate C-acetyltransferase